jgi:hypothetical protein
MVSTEYQAAIGHLTHLAALAGPVDAGIVAPFLGLYERAYRLALEEGGVLRLHLSTRATRVLAMPYGSYTGASGVLAGTPLRFFRDQSGTPVMELVGLERVRWLSGLE